MISFPLSKIKDFDSPRGESAHALFQKHSRGESAHALFQKHSRGESAHALFQKHSRGESVHALFQKHSRGESAHALFPQHSQGEGVVKMAAPNLSKQSGFTLVEILIALAIFAVIGIAAATCLHQMIHYRTRLTKQADEWRMLAITRLLIQKDFSNSINLDDKDIGASLLPLFTGQSNQLTLTRWNHAQTAWLKQMPLFIGIRYSLNAGKLERTVMLPGGNNYSSVIAMGVMSIQWRYLDHNKQWQGSWMASSGNSNDQVVSKLPLALRVTLIVKDVGSVQWDFAKPVVSG